MSVRRLFFYGSLRKGEDNYERFVTDWSGAIQDVASGYVEGYELVDLGTHSSIIRGAADARVIGDVFDVSDDAFRSIEVLETSFEYRREHVEVRTPDGRAIAAEAYAFARPDEIRTLPRIRNGDWTRRLRR